MKESLVHHFQRILQFSCTFLFLLAFATGCSIKRVAVNKLGDALAGGGGAFASDDDPQLVQAAAPFSLKLMESLLNESPRHKGLLLAAAGGFTQYAYAFVQQEADELDERDLAAARETRARARKLYLRARDYALRGLEVEHPGFTAQLRTNPLTSVAVLKKSDVPMAYWAAVSWAAAIGIVKDSTDLIAELPCVEALIDRAVVLDDAYDHGALHSFLITYETVRPQPSEKAVTRARAHFERAVQLSGHGQAGPFVSLAENVSVSQQNRAEFEKLLREALAIDVSSNPQWRLSNLVMQRRARWLLHQADHLIEPETQVPNVSQN
jgi:predicted anti-sigma-YlaC factor YlaD